MPSAEQDQAVVDAVHARTGAALTRTGRARDGTLGGAIFVDLPDGSPGVVTRFLGPLDDARRTASVMAHARGRGLPVPRHHLVVPVGDDVFVVQERLPGEPAPDIDVAVIDAVVEVNDRFAHALADRLDVPILPLGLTASRNADRRHQLLAQHSPRSRRILEAILVVGRELPGEMRGDDLLQIDLDLSNVLFDHDGVVTGVVDWNLGAYRGDRHLALVKTRFEQEWTLQSSDPDPARVAAAQRLDDVLAERLSAQDLRRYWAHRILYQLGWLLPDGRPDVVSWHLDVAEARVL